MDRLNTNTHYLLFIAKLINFDPNKGKALVGIYKEEILCPGFGWVSHYCAGGRLYRKAWHSYWVYHNERVNMEDTVSLILLLSCDYSWLHLVVFTGLELCLVSRHCGPRSPSPPPAWSAR